MIYTQIPNAHTYAQTYPNPNAQMAQYTQIPNLPNAKFSNAQLINTQNTQVLKYLPLGGTIITKPVLSILDVF